MSPTLGQSREQTIRRALGVLQSAECLDSPRQMWSALHALICAGELRRAGQHCHWLAARPRVTPEATAGVALIQARIRQLRGQVPQALASYSALPAPADYLVAVQTAWTVEALLDLGEPETAHEHLCAQGLAGVVPLDLPGRGPLLVARGELQLAQGSTRRAVADFVDSATENPAIAAWRSRAALALAEERPGPAARLAEEELRLAMRWSAPRQIGWALHAHAVVRNDDETPALLGEAIDILEVADARNELVPVLFRTANHLAGRGDWLAARERYLRASELARLDGRTYWVSRVDSALHRLVGRRPQHALTRQQLRVTNLARAGSTNRHIASQLNLSVRAVEFHLSAAYRRLGISGRAELHQMTG